VPLLLFIFDFGPLGPMILLVILAVLATLLFLAGVIAGAILTFLFMVGRKLFRTNQGRAAAYGPLAKD